MTDYCYSTLCVKGSPTQIDQVLSLVIKDNDVDLELACPVPSVLKLDLLKHLHDDAKLHEDRIGKLTPKAFIERYFKNFDIAKEMNQTKPVGSVYLYVTTPLFKSAEDFYQTARDCGGFENSIAMEDTLALLVKLDSQCEKIQAFVEKLIRIIKLDHALLNIQHCGFANVISWRNANWGLLVDSVSLTNLERQACDKVLVNFQNLWNVPKPWFMTLCNKIGHLQLNDIEISLDYEIPNIIEGGVLSFNTKDGVTQVEYTPDQVINNLKKRESQLATA